MAYTITEIARLANVSTRTIRYYDEIGLLHPAEISTNGYRLYKRESLLTLQQILFFREMEVPLKEIAQILAGSAFDPLETLLRHRSALEARLVRTKTLIATVNYTIDMLKGELPMAENELFIGFDEKKYAEEAELRWGSTEIYQESQRRWSSYSKAQKEAIKEMGGEITTRMVGKDAKAKPDDAEVQKAVGEYLEFLNTYFYACDKAFLRDLAKMWVEDARFAVNYERVREGGAQFVKDAVDFFCGS